MRKTERKRITLDLNPDIFESIARIRIYYPHVTKTRVIREALEEGLRVIEKKIKSNK